MELLRVGLRLGHCSSTGVTFKKQHHSRRLHLKIHMNDMDEMEDPKKKMSLVNRYVQSLCGLYSRVARQLKVDRSYVSRVARGERHSEEVERALSSEFNRIISEGDRQAEGHPAT